jgi:hypothetical protein
MTSRWSPRFAYHWVYAPYAILSTAIIIIVIIIITCLVYLTTPFKLLRLNSVEWKGDRWMMIGKNMEGSGRGQI